jgi:glycosyltransferase involved in cell wall biosynthesis
MKILLAHNYYQQRGGEDSVFEAEADLLQQSGHEVKCLVFHNQSIQSWGSRLGAAVGCIFNVRAFFRTLKAIQQFSPDVLHVHNLFPLASPSILVAAKLLRVPVVMTVHNYRMICANAVLYRDNEVCQRCIHQTWPLDAVRFACYQNSKLRTAALVLMQSIHKILGTWHHCVSRYIALSQYEKNMLVCSSVALKAEAVEVKPNFAIPPNHNGNSEESAYFLFIGRLSEEKGISSLLEAFINTNLPLKIIGTGPLESFAREKIAASPNIELLGFLDKQQIYEYLRKSIALIFPSVLPETFGLSIVEAFSAKVPVITTNIGGPAEIVQDGVNGLQVAPETPFDLQTAARKLFENSTLREELAINAYQTYITRYSAPSNYQQLIGIYQDVLKDKYIA